MQGVPWARFSHEHTRFQRHTQPAVVETNVEEIVDLCRRSLNANIGRDAFRLAEESQRLIDEVRAEIVEDTRTRLVSFTPCIATSSLRPVPIEVKFAIDDLLA